MTQPHDSGPIQWARGDVGLKPSAAARPLRHFLQPFHQHSAAWRMIMAYKLEFVNMLTFKCVWIASACFLQMKDIA